MNNDQKSNFKQKVKEYKKTQEYKRVRVNTFSLLATELLFIAMPLVVFSMIYWRESELDNLFTTPEWSFVAVIIIGQVLMKMVAWTVSSAAPIEAPRVLFICAVLIILGLVPALLLLVFVLLAEEPAAGLAAAQGGMVLLALVLYFTFGFAAEVAITHPDLIKKVHEWKHGANGNKVEVAAPPDPT